MVYNGSNNISKVLLGGNTRIGKIYLGNNLVYTGENQIIYDLGSSKISFGEDFMVYDNELEKFGVLSGKSMNLSTLDFDRYETNFDIPIFVGEDRYNHERCLHAVAIDRASSSSRYSDIYEYYYTGAYCYYRIEVDNSIDGGFHYKITANSSSNTEGDVSWTAGATVRSIYTQISIGTGISKTITTDNPVEVRPEIHSTTGEAIGVWVGRITNTVVISSIINNSAMIIDMSKYAVVSDSVKYLDQYDSTIPVIDNNFKNWRYVSYGTLLSEYLSELPSTLITNTVCLGNTGVNYRVRTGVNYYYFKNYFTVNGSSDYSTDGVNGTTNNSISVLMNKATFDDMMDSSNANYNAKMYEYYYNLLNSNDEPYYSMRNKYEEWYQSTAETLYDVYLMSHMADTAQYGISGIVHSFKNYGKIINDILGSTFTVNYNWHYIPAYPQAYNARCYGDTNKVMFKPGFYYLAEPADIATFLRDDILAKCNSTWNKVPTSLHPSNRRTALSAHSIHLATNAQYNGYYNWRYIYTMSSFHYAYKYDTPYYARPCSMYAIE